MNKYVDVTAPWELAKKKTSRKQLQAVIYSLLEGLRVVSGLIYPVMPDTAKIMQTHLGQDPDDSFQLFEKLRQWHLLQAGTLLPKGIMLFPRIDVKKNDEPEALEMEAAPVLPAFKPEISIDALSQIDLRVGTVTAAEAIPKAKKLLKLEIDIGEKRTIVAGIAESYRPEEMIGKQVIVVANLKPAKLMGVLSMGMLLAATDGNGLSVVVADRSVLPGTPLA